MDITPIENEFKKKISEKIEIFPEGDHLVSILKKSPKGWIITDEAHTYMHLSYELDIKDLEKGTRQKIISSTLSMFELEENDGEILVNVEDNMFGDALYNFIQGILKITDINYLSRERVRSTFMDDFMAYITEKVDIDSV